MARFSTRRGGVSAKTREVTQPGLEEEIQGVKVCHCCLVQ